MPQAVWEMLDWIAEITNAATPGLNTSAAELIGAASSQFIDDSLRAGLERQTGARQLADAAQRQTIVVSAKAAEEFESLLAMLPDSVDEGYDIAEVAFGLMRLAVTEPQLSADLLARVHAGIEGS